MIEKIFESGLEDLEGEGVGVMAGYELEGFVDESLGGGKGEVVDGVEGYPVVATVKNGLTGDISTIRA